MKILNAAIAALVIFIATGCGKKSLVESPSLEGNWVSNAPLTLMSVTSHEVILESTVSPENHYQYYRSGDNLRLKNLENSQETLMVIKYLDSKELTLEVNGQDQMYHREDNAKLQTIREQIKVQRNPNP